MKVPSRTALEDNSPAMEDENACSESCRSSVSKPSLEVDWDDVHNIHRFDI